MIQDATAPELATQAAFDQFLAAFDAGLVPEKEWTHAAHLAAGVGCLRRTASGDDALAGMRSGIHNLLRHFGVETTLERGYHESLTRFWVQVARAFLAESGMPPLEATRALVALHGRNSALYRDYYSFEVVRNAEARYGWVPPDRQALPAAWRNGELLVCTNPRLLHLPTIHGFLASSYWAENIPLSIVERSIKNSLCFGLYDSGIQVGFARVVTDLATFAYVGDVFIQPSHRGRKLSKWLMDCVSTHPSLQGLRRWHLVTRDAHGLYEGFGFRTPPEPRRHMERVFPAVYRKENPEGV